MSLRRRSKTPLGSRYVMATGSPTPRPRQDVVPGVPDKAPAAAPEQAAKVMRLEPGHPLADQAANETLYAYEQAFRQRFERLVPVLRELHATQHALSFPERARELIAESLGFEAPGRLLEDAWINGLDTRALYLHGTFELFEQVVNGYWTGRDDLVNEAECATAYFLDCDFHEVDISPCSDGRLLGLRRFILRLPDLAVRTRSHAGALFDVEEDVRYWTRRELLRYREGQPTSADVPSRYLKIAVYHFSSRDPAHEGCMAHGSNERDAADAALKQLRSFRQAIENTFCCGASVDTLLIGVDTDTDAIKVHVPDAETRMSVYRFVDSAALYQQTRDLSPQEASLQVYQALQQAIGQQGWGRGKGQPHEGMLRLVTRLLLSNLSQLDYVARYHDGRYADGGHQERLILVGHEVEEMQVRNFAYFAHLETLEEGGPGLDVGVEKIFRKLNTERGLPIPVVVHYRYDRHVPGSRERVEKRCRRIRRVILERYRELADQGLLGCHMVIRDKQSGSQLERLAA